MCIHALIVSTLRSCGHIFDTSTAAISLLLTVLILRFHKRLAERELTKGFCWFTTRKFFATSPGTISGRYARGLENLLFNGVSKNNIQVGYVYTDRNQPKIPGSTRSI